MPTTILRDTPACFQQALLPLWKQKHWTFLWLDTDQRVLRHYDSQLVDPDYTLSEKRRFQQVFPLYTFDLLLPPQQCNHYDCGVYTCYFAYCVLFDRPREAAIRCSDSDLIRSRIMDQVVLSLLTDPRS